MNIDDINMGAKMTIMLLVMFAVFTFLGDYTGAAARYTSKGDIHGFRYEISEEDITRVVVPSLNKNTDGIPLIEEGSSLTVELFPGKEGVHDGYKILRITDLLNNKYALKSGNFGRSRGQRICTNRYEKIIDNICNPTGPKCNCAIRMKDISTIGLKPSTYAFQVCDGHYDINGCNNGNGVINGVFKIVPAFKKINIFSFFRGKKII